MNIPKPVKTIFRILMIYDTTLKRRVGVVLVIFLASLLFFLPFLRQPDILLNRNNDLVWFFQNFSFFKDQLLTYHHLPLWQNQILSGSPLLGDPQNPLLYLPNYFSLFLPLPLFFFLFLWGHLLLASYGTYLMARKLAFPVIVSLFSGVVYGFSPIMSAHLEAGHLTIIAAISWFPLFLLGLYSLLKERRLPYALLAGITLSTIFVNYLTISFYVLISGVLLILWMFPRSKTTLVLLFLSLITFIIISFPQIFIGWQYFPLTTRNLISVSDIYPSFPAFKSFFQPLINPYSYGLNRLGAETTLFAGLVPQVLALLGFLIIKPKSKILVIIYATLSLWLALNLKAPGYPFLIKAFPILLTFRIATRFWFITILIIALLGSYFLKKIQPKYQLIVCLLVIFELSLFNWKNFDSKPVTANNLSTYEKLLKPLRNQPEYFRIYCPTYCPGQIYLQNKGNAGGYNPIVDSRYYNYITKAAGYGYNLYTVNVPPYQTFPDQPQPDSQAMGLLGIKYVISTYPLTDPHFTLEKSEGNLLLYQNTQSLPRAFTVNKNQVMSLPLSKDLPGNLEVILNPETTNVIINEPFLPLWYAYDQNGNSIPIDIYNNILLSIRVNNVTKLTVSFAPPWMRTLIVISLLSSSMGLIYISRSLLR